MSSRQVQILMHVIFGNNFHRYKRGKLLTTLRVLYPWVMDAIDNNICPFCRRRFDSFSKLRSHLLNNRVCRRELYIVMYNVVEVYDQISSYIRVVRRGDRIDYVAALESLPKHFGSLEEAIKYLVDQLVEGNN